MIPVQGEGRAEQWCCSSQGSALYELDGAGTPGCCSSRVGAVCQAWLPGQEAGAGPVWEGEREEGSAASGLCSGLRHS